MKKILIALTFLIFVGSTAIFVACSSHKYPTSLNEYGIFVNDSSNAVPQTAVADAVRAHFEDTSNNKIKKAVVVGIDGARADALFNVFTPSLKPEKTNEKSLFSGFNALAESGQIIMAYAGGEKGTDTEQETTTAPGWAAILTGKWGDVNGVTDGS